MLKLDDVPNAIDRLQNLSGAPHTADAQYRSAGRASEKSVEFVVWPAHVGNVSVIVRISTRELSDLSGVEFGINSAKINEALQKYRDYLERRANDVLTTGAREVVLDVGSLVPVRSDFIH